MKMKRILFFLVILFLITPALAETESFEFNVMAGSNTLNLDSSFDGIYVKSINGSFYPFVGDALHRIPITINSNTSMNNAVFKFDVAYNSYMKSDFSDIRFQYAGNGTNIPYYIHEKTNGSKATVYIKMNVSSGINNINMNFDIENATNQSNINGMFLHSYLNSTGTYYSPGSNVILYTGNYTTIECRALLYYNSSTTNVYMNSSGNFPRVVRSSSYYDAHLSSSASVGVSLNSYAAANFSLNATDLQNSTFVVNNASKTGFTNQPNIFRIDNGGKQNSTLYQLFIYNSTVNTILFGSVEEILPENSEPVSFNIPPGIFSTLSFNSGSNGYLELIIDSDPHVILLTQNGAQLTTNTILQFQIHPAVQFTYYQIAMDSNFYSIVNSGSSNGNISTQLPINNYFWRVMQPDGTWTEARSFTVVSAPEMPGYLNFKIFNELNNTAASATIKLTNSTTTIQKTGSNITFNSSEVIAGNYSVQLNATGYTTRFYDVVSPENYTLYALPNANASVVYFSLIDNTNTFQFDSTKLEIIKQTPNGSLVVHNSYFDATGFSIATLNNFDSYILKVVSDSGHEKILGNYVQAGQSTVQLVISDIILKETNSSLYGGFTYNLTKSGSAIKFDWLNPNNALIEPMLFQIYKNNELVMNISSDAPFGSINYQDNVDGEMKLDPNATYRIVLTAKTVNGTIRVNEFYKVGGESVSIDFEKIPIVLRIVISLVLLILVASLFNITNAKFSAIVVTLVAGFLAMIGFLPILPTVLIWVLFVAIVAYKTNNR